MLRDPCWVNGCWPQVTHLTEIWSGGTRHDFGAELEQPDRPTGRFGCEQVTLRPQSVIADEFEATFMWETTTPAVGMVTDGLDNTHGSAAEEGLPVIFHQVILTGRFAAHLPRDL